MAKSLIPISHGRDYQARFFWLRASGLFDPGSKVCKVGFEAPDAAKSFEDVVVSYREPIHDPVIGDIAADYFQAKFHVNSAGAITADSLTDPKFIGATTYSLLQKLKDAQRAYAPGGKGARFSLVLPWNVHPDDALADLLDSNAGVINLHRLMSGGATPRLGVRYRPGDRTAFDDVQHSLARERLGTHPRSRVE